MVNPRSEIESLPEVLAKAKAALNGGSLDQAACLFNVDAVERILVAIEAESYDKRLVFDFADMLSRIGREAQAERCYQRLLNDGPDAAIYNKLGCLCLSLGRLSEGVQYQHKALELMPDRPELMANLARAQMETGDVQQGIELLRRAVQLMPDNSQAHSNLLFRLHQLPNLDRQMLYDEHRRWGQKYAHLAKATHENTIYPDRRLRIGYISPDFRRHSVTYFFESLLDGHNRREFCVYGYGNVEYPDQTTERLKHKFDCYRNIFSISDNDVATLIKKDQIDILIDLAGHVGDNRLLVMARKPAPIQVTYLGYPDTTGLDAIDYRFTDALADLPDSQQLYSEQLVFLPNGFLCYQPPDYAPSVSPLPADEKDYTTFGSFNNSCKLNSTIIGLWAEILRADQRSRLLLKIKAGEETEIADRYLRQFSQLGIDSGRVSILGWKSPIEHFRTYAQVDIALDTYPYNGTTTTCEALWMGVPTICLVGQCHASRVGLSILNRIGLEFFAASTAQEYVAKALALSSNRSALSQMRSSMRARIATSGLCHGKAFARDVEAAYRVMWHRWCHSRGDAVGDDRSGKQVQQVLEINQPSRRFSTDLPVNG
jgi:protein O-GlcNAc transferase